MSGEQGVTSEGNIRNRLSDEESGSKLRRPGIIDLLLKNQSLIMIVLTIVIIWCTVTQINIVRHQSETEELTNRPWIAAPRAKVTISGSQANVDLIFKNFGHMPTRGLFIGGAVSTAGSNKEGKDFWRIAADEACEAGRNIGAKDENLFQEFSAVPDSDLVWNSTSGFLKIDFDVSKFKPYAFVSGCVIYGSPLDNRLHHSKFLVTLAIDSNLEVSQNVYTLDPD